MKTQPTRLPRTTRIGTPNDHTQFILQSIGHGTELATVVDLLARGADPNLECAEFQRRDDTPILGLTPTALAVCVDSHRHQLLLTPLLLNHGGNIRQVDSQGRTLMSFAGSAPVAEYLQEHGAPCSSWDAVLIDAVDEDSEEPEAVHQPLLVPESAWREVVAPDLVCVMDRLGYFKPPADADIAADASADTSPSSAGPPLIARFAAPALIEDAIHDKDTVRLSRLVELDLVDNEQRYAAEVSRRGQDYEFHGLTAVGLATVVGCTHGLLAECYEKDLPDHPGDVSMLACLADVVDCSGPHTQFGDSLLHLAIAPQVCQWLLERGLSPDDVNHARERPIDIVPGDVRAVIERFVLERAVGDANKGVKEDGTLAMKRF
ncbi:hypothetical protein P3W24_06760 [Luteibacter sp. PPL201]|uniref:Ankyrin repeat domain-containing protein n=1 Tax=Luteibacter sahnii TaxID=3021977 RepID=A0ABT6BBM7_9GAMM